MFNIQQILDQIDQFWLSYSFCPLQSEEDPPNIPYFFKDLMLSMWGQFASDFDDYFVDIRIIHDEEIQDGAEHVISDEFRGYFYES